MINEAVVRSDTSSKCAALVVKQTKPATYDLMMVGLRIGHVLVKIHVGPA